MSTPFKILVGDTATPQARIPKSGEQTYLAPVTIDNSTGVEDCFEIEATVQQSGTAGYTALLVNVIETSVGSGTRLPFEVKVDGLTTFKTDWDGDVTITGETSIHGLAIQDQNGLYNGETNDGSVYLAGGDSTTNGFYFVLFGGAGVKAGDLEWRNDDGLQLHFDNSASLLDMQANALSAAGGNFSVDVLGKGFVAALGIDTAPTTTYPLSVQGDGLINGDLAVINDIRMGSISGPKWTSGSGTPEGVVTSDVGGLYARTDGGANTALYVKETGVGNTGWAAVSVGGTLQTTGTFTPTIEDNTGSASEGQTYSTQAGNYIKTGKQVTVNIILNVTSTGTLTSAERAQIGGLPFVSSSATDNIVSISVGNASNMGTGTGVITGIIGAGADKIDLYEWNSHTGVSTTNNFTIAEFGGSGEIILSCTYWTD